MSNNDNGNLNIERITINVDDIAEGIIEINPLVLKKDIASKETEVSSMTMEELETEDNNNDEITKYIREREKDIKRRKNKRDPMSNV